MIEYTAQIRHNGNRYIDFEQKLRDRTLVASQAIEGRLIAYRYSDGLVTANEKQLRGEERSIALAQLFSNSLRSETILVQHHTEHKLGKQSFFGNDEPGVFFKLKNQWFEIEGAIFALLSDRNDISRSMWGTLNKPGNIPLITARLKLRNPEGPNVTPLNSRGIWYRLSKRRRRGVGQLHEPSHAWLTGQQYRVSRDQHENAGYMLTAADPSTFALYGYAVRPDDRLKKKKQKSWTPRTIKLHGITEPAAAFITAQLQYVI